MKLIRHTAFACERYVYFEYPTISSAQNVCFYFFHILILSFTVFIKLPASPFITISLSRSLHNSLFIFNFKSDAHVVVENAWFKALIFYE